MSTRSRGALQPGDQRKGLGIGETTEHSVTKIVAGGPSAGEARAEARRARARTHSDDDAEGSVEVVDATNAAGLSSVKAATASDAFDRLRRQFERRRVEQHDELERAMAAVDINLFMEDVHPGTSGGAPEFQLRGALPPTVEFRGAVDVPVAAAIGHSERIAARELIARHKEEDQAAVDQAATVVRTGRRRLRAISASPVPVVATDNFFVEASLEDSLRDHTVDERPASQASSSSRPRTEDFSHQVEGSPLASKGIKTLEKTICDFHELAEVRADDSHIFAELDKQRTLQESQQDSVRRWHLERRHRQRERAIATECIRRQKQEAFYDYKAGVDVGLIAKHDEKIAKKEQVKRDTQERRARAAARKSAAGAHREFAMRHGSLDKTCRQHDVRKIKRDDKMRTCMRADAHQEAWAKKSTQIASRRVLCEAQRKLRDEEDADRLQFLIRREKGCQNRQVEETRERIRAQQEFDAYVRTAQKELMAREEEAAAAQDIETYEKTLAAFRDLADGVRQNGLNMRRNLNLHTEGDTTSPDGNPDAEEDDALVCVEPRVRSAFAAATGAGEEMFIGLEKTMLGEDGTRWALNGEDTPGVEAVEHPVPRLFPQFSALPSISSAVAPVPPSSMIESRTQRAEAMQAAAPPTAVAEAPMLSARPFLAFDRESPTPLTDRVAQRQVQSLAALRRVRRTGPFSARGFV